MLAPKRILHRKVQRGSMKGQAKGNTQLHFGDFGIQALERHWITNRQIEAARIAMTRYMKRGGKVYITIFPDKPITKKPAAVSYTHLDVYKRQRLQGTSAGCLFVGVD